MNSMPPSVPRYPRNFVEHLCHLAAERPTDTALIVVREQDGAPADTLISYAALDRRVRALAAQLQERFGPGERALLLLDNDDHYVVAFFACLYAGLTAVPVFPPESARPQHLARLTGIAQDAQARCLLTTGAILTLLGTAVDGFAGCAALAVDAVDAAGADAWRPHAPADDDIAFLQYTSGSTSAPKGVMVSHGNLMANERAIEEGLSVGPDDVFVSWLPLYHDMGLIGGLLQPVHRGIPVALMTPQFFLERPIRWLEAISRHRGSISGGPDFAYRLCLERVKDAQLAQLDLSSWRLAFSGAEPVRHDTLEAFIERFAPAGFQAGAVFPCYGLAEATLFVTGGRRGTGMVTRAFSAESLGQDRAQRDDGGNIHVGCGHAPSAHEVRIVDPQSLATLGEGAVGEIWASGPSIAQGYWQRPEETAQSFVERDGRRWLRTGDLGFLHEDELYITGRIKDLIILRGQNVYPQDIERTIEAEVEVVRKGRVAAFAVPLPAGGEGVGVAVEVSRGLQNLVRVEALVEALSRAAAGVCREPVSVAVLLNPGALPKTSSGKLQRSACRRGWERGKLDAYALYEHGRFVLGAGQQAADPVAAQPPFDELEAALAQLWQQVLGTGGAPERQAHFFAGGGNSLAAVQLAARIGEQWEIDFPVRLLFERPRFDELAAEIRNAQAQGRRQPKAAIPVLPVERRGEPLPLSHAQARQWFLWQLDPKSSAYHLSLVLRLSGPLRVDALRAAFDGLVARHESLRTVFRPAADGMPAQWIQNAIEVDLPLIDLREVAAGEREAQAAEQARRLVETPFDLTCGPLLRVALIRTADEAQRLVLVMHHIVSDGASMQVLIDELAARYAAHLQGRAAELAAPAIQYADYALWQRDWLAAGEGARQLDWWRAQLGDEHPLLSLPSDHPRQARAGYRAARHSVELPAELSARLRQLAEARGATLFMVLLAGFQALLHRYTGQQDIRVGVPVANRQRTETAGLIGFFVNTLVMRNLVHGRSRLDEVLAQTREMALGAQGHQDLPFEQLVEALQPERSLSHSPLFQVLFNHLHEDWRALRQLPGLVPQPEEADERAAQFELALDIRERSDGQIRASFEYAAELFEAQTIERLAGHYLAVLRALAERPEQALGDLALLGEAEQAQLCQWGENPQRYPDAGPLHRLFERQARERPQATALVFGAEALSYAELNRRANRLAHRLIALGVRPETKVGIALERSVEMVVGLVAILKAGGAYVPLDPDHPGERLAWMAGDSGIGLLLTQSHLKGRIPGQALSVLALDSLDLAGEPEHDPQVALHGDNLAYVIYTSGSTGRPKGAANRHRSLYNRLAWMQEAYRLDASDSVLQKTPFGFDVSVWEFFWPLMVGARLVVANPGEHRDPGRLVETIRQHAVTTLHFVPSMLQAFLAHEGIEACTSLSRIFCSGEALPAEAQNAVFRRLPQAALYNLYGPTEAAIDVTHWSCRDDGQSQVPIGRPIGGIRTWVLDAALNPVPPGVAGELYLGGVGLARGYLNRPALTAERFVADPFGSGERLYRSGDLVRWNSEGQLEYLGRIDHQVKVRGFRIELGEIEAQLLAQPEVREALVVAREGPGGVQLVGYLSAPAGQALDGALLRERLGRVLPDYMVPSALVVLESLPLNPNGKVDRKALPEPELAGSQAYEAPLGEIEERLAEVWAEVLGMGMERVGRRDSFFEIGGHSLLLLKVHHRLKERLEVCPSVVELFKYPTIESLAAFLGEGGPHDSASLQRAEDRARRQRGAFLQRKPASERTPT
ncbi:amino acid adenylation domain protein [Azotobacter chroococcum NCIMB 8003]|uniref:Amino acid adenylation domain protein n=1 Tax=Azotobacter chroococcum NCIMB 8003 TaxID=1328314 RepID=A0A0C4WKG0_9GAMM|nr:non-ribosomal peptide synthetase [Azotobacter chroococcum]AJE23278.1 amino acid adenylation domain protein [Azotobacter chroococcum NCIMB 8003]